jgi:hypothetical protein
MKRAAGQNSEPFMTLDDVSERLHMESRRLGPSGEKD